jgi:hypothetical protein
MTNPGARYVDSSDLLLAMMDGGRPGVDARLKTGALLTNALSGLERDELAAHEEHQDSHTDRGDSSQGWGGHIDEHTDNPCTPQE